MFVFFISDHHPRLFQGFSLDTPIFRNVLNFESKKMFVAGCLINNVDHHGFGQTMIEKLPIVMILSFLLKKNILTILDKEADETHSKIPISICKMIKKKSILVRF